MNEVTQQTNMADMDTNDSLSETKVFPVNSSAFKYILTYIICEIIEKKEIDPLEKKTNDFTALIAAKNGRLLERTPGVRIQNYFEETVRIYNDYAFKAHFRVSRTAFEELTQLLEPLDEFSISDTGGREPVPVPKQLLVFCGSSQIQKLYEQFQTGLIKLKAVFWTVFVV